MDRYIDLTGQRFELVEVLAYHGSVNGRAKWLCLCHKCKEKSVKSRRFLLSRTKEHPDCGCSYKAKKEKMCRDLSGEIFGAIKVLYPEKNTGEKYKRARLYMCECMVCGKQRIIPSMEIKSNMSSCGCLRYQAEEMKRRSQLGVAANIKDGAHVPLLKRQEANKNSKTGVRGVFPGKNGTYIAFAQVAGKQRVIKGFKSIASAKKARDKLKVEMIEEFGFNSEDFK